MIERYALSPIKELWTEEAQYKRWLEVEVAAIRAFEKLGEAPAGTADLVMSKAVIDVKKIQEIESIVDHDIIAFIKAVTENMGDEARFFHKGMTSTDVVDSAMCIALKKATTEILNEMYLYRDALASLAKKYKYAVTVGRTHGIHAEPTTFGLKILSFLAETERNIDRLKSSLDSISHAKISGAVGNYANISPEAEEIALGFLDLKPSKVSTQVVPRDHHAELLNTFALIGTGIERFATEIRHLQKTEVLELMEPFKKGQRGSSAMPHKKNPILCERLSGMARLLRSYTVTGLENIVLWHERDISHSSVERMTFPDSTMLSYYMVKKAAYLAENLVVFPDKMLETFERSYNLVYSQRTMLALVEKGISREDSYKIVQENALAAWDTKTDFKALLKKDERITKYISEKDIDEMFTPDYFLVHVDDVFKRFGL